VFQGIWSSVGKNIARYKQYPRLVGETGGKDFVFAHVSCDVEALCTALVRGAFEYQGQKCSAASRAYVPRSQWKRVRDTLGGMLSQVRMGDVADFRNFVGAVIDERSFTKLRDAIGAAKQTAEAEVILGGECDGSVGWFVQPTVIEAKDPRYDTMCTELFGPVLTIHVYDDKRYAETLELCNTTSEYALTGAVFANDRAAIRVATDALRFAAGNFYVNDKPTGAVVGQQPFGGARASGTNDKAGSVLNLLRWSSPRVVKENFVPPRQWTYPFMAEP
jgi:1-pyrroline-5-carboxylate dehydrogenase